MNNPAPPVNVTISKYRGPGKITVADARPKFEAIKGGKAMEPYTGKSATTVTFSEPASGLPTAVSTAIVGAGVEARVIRGEGPSVWVDAFTLEAPHGERREVVARGWGSPRQAQQMERAGIMLSDVELSR